MLTAAALVLFTLLCIVLSDDLAWDNVTRSTRNELVFHERHRGYGAFVLRREYDRRFIIAFLVALGLLGGGLLLMRAFGSNTVRADKLVHVTEFVIDPTVYEAARAPERTEPTAPTPKPQPQPAPAPKGGTSFVEAGARTDSTIAVDTSTSRDTLANAGPAGGTGPTGTQPSGGGGGETGGGDDGSSGGTKELGEVDSAPFFPGGELRMREFIQRYVRFPEEFAGKQKVYVEFVVDEEGRIGSVVARGRSQGALAEAAENVVKRMPAWEPAIRKGKKVRCRLVLPISFETH